MELRKSKGLKSRKGIDARTLAWVILIILLLTLAGLLYYILIVLPKLGGGVVEDNPQKVGKMEFLFAVYGPGVGDKPYFSRPMGVATDSSGNMYVTDSVDNRVCVFNKEGRYLFSWGKQGIAWPLAGYKATWKPGTFNNPYGIAIDENGDVYVADSVNQQIQVFNSRGKFLRSFPKPWDKIGHGGGGRGEGLYPMALDVKDGKVYIADAYQIVIFTTEGKFIRQFGSPGRQEGRLDRPNGIAVGKDGTIYVSDSNNLRLEAFTNAGKLKWVVGAPVESVTDVDEKSSREFGLPRGIALDAKDNIFVTDAFHFSIKVYDKNGNKLGEVGERGTLPGTFNFPNDIAITKNGIAYITDRANNRVQAVRIPTLITPEGSLLGGKLPWWPLLLLLPILALLYLLARKDRIVADRLFIGAIQQRGKVPELADNVKSIRVTPAVYEVVIKNDVDNELAGLLKPVTPDPDRVKAYQEEFDLATEDAETIAVGRRTLLQKLLATHSVFLVDSKPLVKRLKSLDVEVLRSESFIRQLEPDELDDDEDDSDES